MMKKGKDILDNESLKKMPVTVPEGYFADFRKNCRPWESGQREERERPAGVIVRLRPYLAMAAMFAVIAAVGTATLQIFRQDEAVSEYESFIFADLIPLTEPDAIYYYDDFESEGISDDEIIDYLIFNGTTVDNINY